MTSPTKAACASTSDPFGDKQLELLRGDPGSRARRVTVRGLPLAKTPAVVFAASTLALVAPSPLRASAARNGYAPSFYPSLAAVCVQRDEDFGAVNGFPLKVLFGERGLSKSEGSILVGGDAGCFYAQPGPLEVVLEPGRDDDPSPPKGWTHVELELAPRTRIELEVCLGRRPGGAYVHRLAAGGGVCTRRRRLELKRQLP